MAVARSACSGAASVWGALIAKRRIGRDVSAHDLQSVNLSSILELAIAIVGEDFY